MVNWNDPKSKVSKYFTVGELTWLPSWAKYHTPSASEQENLTRLANKMDEVREILGKPIKVHVCIRPAAYNKQIGGAPASLHITGLAIDFDCGENCNTTRATLVPLLEKLGMRCEDHNGPWVHLDLGTPRPNRYFKP